MGFIFNCKVDNSTDGSLRVTIPREIVEAVGIQSVEALPNQYGTTYSTFPRIQCEAEMDGTLTISQLPKSEGEA